MDYMSTSEAAGKWQISLRQVQRHLAEKRVPCAKKAGRIWLIPAQAQKPEDLRTSKDLPRQTLCQAFVELKTAGQLPVPQDNPACVLQHLENQQLALLCKSSLAYLRGDFPLVLSCYRQAEKDLPVRLNLCPAAMAAAISLGDKLAYQDIFNFASSLKGPDQADPVTIMADLTLATAAISASAPGLAPAWLKEGDFSLCPAVLLPDLLYIRCKYLYSIHRCDAAHSLAQTALYFIRKDECLSFHEIYLTLMCAVTSLALDERQACRKWLLAAMDLALPHAFITPFAEHLMTLGGLVETFLTEHYPDLLEPVLTQWARTGKHWVNFHNQFTKDHITHALTPRESHIAQMAARRISYEKIGQEFGISTGRVKNIMSKIYDKLLISKRDELADYVLFREKGSSGS